MNDTEGVVGSVTAAALNVFPQLEVRYRDGYRAVRVIVAFGNLIKKVSTVAGVLICILIAQVGFIGFLGGAVFGGLIWLGLFVSGVIICAQGQLLSATLDSAINNSPFLDNPQRASIMSLSANPTSGEPASDLARAAEKAIDKASIW